MLTVSVIVPSLNQGRFIGATIRSVLDQDYPYHEVFVVDAGSSDDTPDVLRGFATRIRSLSEPDQGQADAVNKGILATSGDIIGWLNSDDVYYPGALGAVCAYLESNPDVDVVYGEADFIDVNGTVLAPYRTENWNPRRLPETCFLCQPATFFRRRVVDRFGLLDSQLQYCMDYEFWLRLSAAGARFAYLRQRLAGSRLHASSKTLAARLEVHAEIDSMLGSRLGRVPDGWLANHAHTLLELDDTAAAATPLRSGLRCAWEYVRLSMTWNRSISPYLLTQGGRRVAAGVLDTLRLRKSRPAHQGFPLRH